MVLQHFLGKEKVPGSNPGVGSMSSLRLDFVFISSLLEGDGRPPGSYYNYERVYTGRRNLGRPPSRARLWCPEVAPTMSRDCRDISCAVLPRAAGAGRGGSDRRSLYIVN